MADKPQVKMFLHFVGNAVGFMTQWQTLCGEGVWTRPGDNGDELPLWVEVITHRFLLADYEDIVCPECMRRVQDLIARSQ